MRTSQTKTIELSECREALAKLIEERNALPADQEPTADLIEKIDTATKKIRSVEVELRAAITAEDGEDQQAEERRAAGDTTPEEREFRALEAKASLAGFVAAAIEERAVDGAEAEFVAANKLPPNQIPLRMFAPAEGAVEERTKTDTDIATRPRRWIDRLFAGTAAGHLGLTFDTVEPGSPSYPVTKTGGTPAQRGREEAAAAAAWTIGVETLDPTRMSLHYEFAIEDAARIPGLEAALQRDMRSAMRERLDHVIFAGDDGANEDAADIGGYFEAAGTTAKTLKQADKVKGDKTVEALASLIDGIHAESAGDVRIVASVPWNQLLMATVHNAAADNETVGEFVRRAGFSWRTRAGIATGTAANADLAAVGLGRGQAGAGVVAMWSGATLIRDPYSAAAKGQVKLTLHALWNWRLVRASNFAKLSAVA